MHTRPRTDAGNMTSHWLDMLLHLTSLCINLMSLHQMSHHRWELGWE